MYYLSGQSLGYLEWDRINNMAEWRKGDFVITTDPQRLDLDDIHGFLSQESTWAKGIPRAVFDKSLLASLCFGLLHNRQQAGFARVISDYSTVAYLGDVFVVPEYRGHGLSKWLMACVMAHSDLQHLRRWILVTGNAHSLYRKYGFKELAQPETYMELYNPRVYE
jgi:GNAT superfamily N-acetyltransferase